MSDQPILLQELRSLVAQFQLVSIHDEQAFLAKALAAYHKLPADRAARNGARTAVLQTLCREIHAGLVRWDNDAYGDTWRISFTSARYAGASEQEAQEIAQQVTNQLFKKPESLDDPTALLQWIRVVARRNLSKKRQQTKREIVASDLIDSSEEDNAPAPLFVTAEFTAEVESRLIVESLVQVLKACGLTNLQIAVLLYSYVYDWPIDIICAHLKRNPANIYNLRSKAIKHVQQSPHCREQIRRLLADDSAPDQEGMP